MALSTEFCLPNSSFDPTKYSRKSSTRTKTTVKNLSQAASKTASKTPATITASAPQLDVVDSTKNGFGSMNIDANNDAKHTTCVTKDKSTASSDVETKQPTSSGSEWEVVDTATLKDFDVVTMSDFGKDMEQPAFVSSPKMHPGKHATAAFKNKSTASLDDKAEQPTSFSSSEWEEIDGTNSEACQVITIPESMIEQQTVVSSPKSVSFKPGSGESQSCPTTLLTAESGNLAPIPPPDDTESTDTRRLVSIRRIRNIRQAKVENRWLTLAQVDEWTCTVPRHAFKEGELVIYIEIDAFLPCADERFGKMATLQTYDGILGHRVKTKRFGSYPNKLLVQGYIFPIDKFEEIYQEIRCILNVVVDNPFYNASHDLIKHIICAMYRNKDWAATIGVKKWEESKQVNKPDKHQKLGAVPTRVFRKTNITHFEDCPNLFTKGKYFANEYQQSIKMDGASMSVYFVKKTAKKFHDLNELPEEEVGPNMVLSNGRFGVTSKSVDLNELSTCSFGYWKTALKNDLPAKLSKLDRSIAVQGEICGPGINKNREKLDETQFFVYSMWDIASQKYIDPRKVEALAAKLGLKHVPVLGYVKIREIASCHNDLRGLADKRPGEGLVFKCVRDGRSFKVHSPSYKILHNC